VRSRPDPSVTGGVSCLHEVGRNLRGKGFEQLALARIRGLAIGLQFGALRNNRATREIEERNSCVDHSKSNSSAAPGARGCREIGRLVFEHMNSEARHAGLTVSRITSPLLPLEIIAVVPAQRLVLDAESEAALECFELAVGFAKIVA